jgi:hypothetical protein
VCLGYAFDAEGGGDVEVGVGVLTGGGVLTAGLAYGVLGEG